MLPTVPDLAGLQQKTGMEGNGPRPSAFRRACRPGGSGTGGTPTAAADRHRFRTTAGHTFVWFCICLHLVSECAPTRRLLPTSPSLAGWPWGCKKKMDLRGCFYHPPWQLLGLAGRTAAVDSSGWTRWLSQECSAPSPSRVLC